MRELSLNRNERLDNKIEDFHVHTESVGGFLNTSFRIGSR